MSDDDNLETQLAAAEEGKSQAYRERNMLVAALSRLYPSYLMQHPDDPVWDRDWRWIVCIEAPVGQLTWHLHDSHLPMFNHLPEKANNWDGHSTEEKYARLAKLGTSVFYKDGSLMTAEQRLFYGAGEERCRQRVGLWWRLADWWRTLR